jgi:aerobic C4-dicarboxylate transport protein
VAASTPDTASAVPAAKRDRTHYLYIAVIVAVAIGIAVGLIAPDFAVELKPIGTGFVNLIKMMPSARPPRSAPWAVSRSATSR